MYLRGEVNLKRTVSIIVVFAIISASLAFGVSAEYSDVPYKGASSWAVTELDRAAEYGFITDKIKDNMNASITREEFAEIAVRLYEKYTGNSAPYSDMSVFVDTKNPEIFKAYSLKIVNGTDLKRGLFSPDRLISREQVAVMMFRAVNAIEPDTDFSTAEVGEFRDEKDISGWALESVRFMNKNGFLKGEDGKINPQGTCTREMAVLIATRVYEKYTAETGGYAAGGNSAHEEGINESYNWVQIVVNDMEIFQDDYRIKEKQGFDYIFISAEKFRYAFKWPYVGNYTYPEIDISDGSISASWRDEESIVLQVNMQEGNTEALVNGTQVDIGIAPYSENGKLYIPINLLISAMEMNVETNSRGDILFIQYKSDFPRDILLGTWSDVNTDLFTGFQDIASGAVSLSSFATAYEFSSDGTYGLRMASVGGFNDTFIMQRGKYEVMGSTIMCYDIIETVYKGKPFKLMYEDKSLTEPQYWFIGNYNDPEDKIEIGGMWLNRIK